MEQLIKDAMNDEIIKQAAQKFNVDFNQVSRVGGFENFIYEFTRNEQDIILRFVHCAHRIFTYVVAEIEFIDYLSKSGANVSTIVNNIDGEIAFQLPCENNHYFTVTAFTKAKGTFIREERNDTLFVEMFGEAVGKLHKLTKDFKPTNKRYHWYEEDYVSLGRKYLPEEYHFLIDITDEHIKNIKALNIDKDSYGLIHTDLHFGNMFYDQETLTFFDWDDASYKHFISDIAIIIYYQFAFTKLSDKEIEDKTIAFLIPFLKGYQKENKLDEIWFTRLNDFLRLRTLVLIMVVFAAGEDTINSHFGQTLINKFIPRIKNDIPFLNLKRVLNGIY